MAFLITTPDIISGAATDLATIGLKLAVANAAATTPTTGILAAGLLRDVHGTWPIFALRTVSPIVMLILPRYRTATTDLASTS
jgi:hypothetical protein